MGVRSVPGVRLFATCCNRLQPHAPYADWTPIEFGSEDDNDHTAKLVLTGLAPARTYTYQLKLGGATHDGQFRTAPTADGELERRRHANAGASMCTVIRGRHVVLRSPPPARLSQRVPDGLD